MLSIPSHQVAGHQAIGGKLGPLVDESGCFYKPLQGDKRGTNEVAFYTSFSSNTKIPDHIRKYFPIFYGTKLLEASDGSGLLSHLILQDIVSDRINPSVMDVKIGSRTWPIESSEDYIAKSARKDRESTSLALGFRISGFQIFGQQDTGLLKPDKNFFKKISVNGVRLSLRKFVSSNVGSDLEPDCAYAEKIYGGSSGILAQLLQLKTWFEDQTIFHFHSCSILLICESAIEGSSAEIKLVDFAHVVDGKGIIDHNFLGGLCSLIKFISEILITPEKCPITVHSDKPQLSCDEADNQK